METKYYKDNYNLYYKDSKIKKTYKFINNLFEDPKIANMCGVLGFIVPTMVMII